MPRLPTSTGQGLRPGRGSFRLPCPAGVPGPSPPPFSSYTVGKRVVSFCNFFLFLELYVVFSFSFLFF